MDPQTPRDLRDRLPRLDHHLHGLSLELRTEPPTLLGHELHPLGSGTPVQDQKYTPRTATTSSRCAPSHCGKRMRANPASSSASTGSASEHQIYGGFRVRRSSTSKGRGARGGTHGSPSPDNAVACGERAVVAVTGA